ncbi:hypothetical protein Leryth_023170 [Lithospermum erythrorhizon]|nr:hypothetical protein Leryth_023170 [Lithospermum erythrorhizon]
MVEHLLFEEMEDVENLCGLVDDLEKRVDVVEKSITNGGVFLCSMFCSTQSGLCQSDLQWVEGNSETIPAYITGHDDECEIADFLTMTSAFRKMEDAFKYIAASLDDLKKRVDVVEKSITDGGVHGCIYVYLEILSLQAIAYNYSFKSTRWTCLGTLYNLMSFGYLTPEADYYQRYGTVLKTMFTYRSYHTERSTGERYHRPGRGVDLPRRRRLMAR